MHVAEIALRGAIVHLDLGLGVILAFVGIKLLGSDWFHISTFVSWAVVVAALATKTVASPTPTHLN